MSYHGMSRWSCRHWYLLAAALAASPSRGTGQVPADWVPHIDALSARIAADVAADGVGGITAGVGIDGEILWARGFGWADRERRVEAASETIYRVGSISKSITAVLMAILVDDGRIPLDGALYDLVPETRELANRPDGAGPTLRQVASHTAGLVREPALEGAAAGPIDIWRAQIERSIPNTAFQSAPGAAYSYSNIGFGILGYGLESAGGAPFMHQVRHRVFQPLGMSSSTFVIGPALAGRLAKGYANGTDGEVDASVPAVEHIGRGYKVPNGGVYSTVGDLVSFAGGVMGRGGPSLLSPEMRGEVLSIQTPEDDGAGYGLGFSIQTVGSRTLAGHGGSVAGYTAYLLFDVSSGATIAFLRNYNRGQTDLGGAAREFLLSLP